MVENDQEFIPAVTHDVIAFPHGLPQVLGNGHEHLIADGMPELIIDFLKAVHIHHDEGEVVGMIGVDDLFKEIPTIVGPRQFVRINLLLVFVNDIDDRAATEAAAGQMIRHVAHNFEHHGVHVAFVVPVSNGV